MSTKKSDLSRRQFMASTAGCLASAGLVSLIPGRIRADETTQGKDEVGEIPRRKLGRTGLEVPVVSMGAGACNDPGLVQAAYKSGLRLFDTAANYAFGRNEQMVGRALATLGVRQECVIATKGITPDERARLTPETAARRVVASVEGSLRRLKTDYIDIFFLHDVRDIAPVGNAGIKEGMARVKKEGKVRFIGVTTHANMAEIVNATVAEEIYDVVLTSVNFTMADDEIMTAIENAASKNIGVIAMKTQAGGAAFPNPDTLREYDAATINSAALKWVLNQESIATAIPGIGNYDHLRANTAIGASLAFTDEEKLFLSDNTIRLGMGFCRQCSQCLPSCPHGADIPDLMRTHMYAAQYGDFQKARSTLNSIPSRAGLAACASCDACSASCTHATVPIGKKIEDLKLIYA